jgi:2-amino-4-hydroxy-6-hydroxymethyldihydropteridine diphosphokinase
MHRLNLSNAESGGSTAAIALGGNLGDSLSILESAIATLNQTPGIRIITQSSWYQTKPVGPPQSDYINGCALLHTTFTPQQLLSVLLTTEKKFGRERQQRWGARTLDLDLLLFNDVILDTDFLKIPHPRMTQRGFVMVPLAEIAPDWIDPRSGCTIVQLMADLDAPGVAKI